MTSRRRRKLRQELCDENIVVGGGETERLLASLPRTEITIVCQSCDRHAAVVTIDQEGHAQLNAAGCRAHRVDERGTLHLTCRCPAAAQLQVSRGRLDREDARRGAATIYA